MVSEGEIAVRAAGGMSEADLRSRGADLPLGRHQTPQDAAYAALYLLSSQVTGAILNVDAGTSMLPVRPPAPHQR